MEIIFLSFAITAGAFLLTGVLGNIIVEILRHLV